MMFGQCKKRTKGLWFGLWLAVILCLAAGCQNDPGPTAAGAATGAAVGGIIGHQSGEEGEGAAIGAVTGGVIGHEIGEARREDDDFDDDFQDRDVDYGDLLTEEEKERILERSGEASISDWGDYLTAVEKERLLERSEIGDR